MLTYAITFKQSEFYDIQAALLVAAEVYEADAAKMRKLGFDRLAGQFSKQMGEARRLATHIEEKA